MYYKFVWLSPGPGIGFLSYIVGGIFPSGVHCRYFFFLYISIYTIRLLMHPITYGNKFVSEQSLRFSQNTGMRRTKSTENNASSWGYGLSSGKRWTSESRHVVRRWVSWFLR